MSYDSKKTEFDREHIEIVEIDLDYCSLTSGVGPCTATETGNAKCYNTLQSTNDLPNFAKTIKTYRFCKADSRQPLGLDAIPNLLSVSISPTQIDLSGGLGFRASVTCNFKDHPHSDIDIDKYVDDRTYIASDRGTFWTKLRSRNPNYQFRELRVLSGYLNADGTFDAANFQTRYYVIDKMNVGNGRASITAKDPLKLVSRNKSQAPAASKGLLQASILSTTTSLTLTPAGIGNLEYPASGKIKIKSEVISFTRVADVLTLVRGQNNTVATDHSSNSTAQLCLEYIGKQLNFIVNDLMTNYSTVSASFIPAVAWQTEVDTYLSGLLTGIIVEPTDVNKLLKELSESMPHYLWWEERDQAIQLTALKAPPISADVLDMDENLTDEGFIPTDKPEMRVSTVFVNFGQFDPTKKLDEPGNYEQTYVRVDTNSISKYGSNEIKVINSRWISNVNKAAALQLGALIGRRFSDIPREISFSLDAKDSDVWAGQSHAINHRDITDFSGSPLDTVFQITSVKESGTFKYQALEFTYGEALPEDEGGGDPDIDLVILGSDQKDINLRTVYNGLFPAPDASTQVKFIIEGGVKVGSTFSASVGLVTGTWPAGAIVTLQLNTGAFTTGAGGNATTGNGDDGGDAIRLDYDLTLINNGVIGGGGGGGASDNTTTGPDTHRGGGGGGAGFVFGTGQASTTTDPVLAVLPGIDGTLETGGVGGIVFGVAAGADAGDLGQVGSNSSSNTGGAAGIAIDKNGFTLTETVTGDIRGSIIA